MSGTAFMPSFCMALRLFFSDRFCLPAPSPSSPPASSSSSSAPSASSGSSSSGTSSSSFLSTISAIVNVWGGVLPMIEGVRVGWGGQRETEVGVDGQGMAPHEKIERRRRLEPPLPPPLSLPPPLPRPLPLPLPLPPSCCQRRCTNQHATLRPPSQLHRIASGPSAEGPGPSRSHALKFSTTTAGSIHRRRAYTATVVSTTAPAAKPSHHRRHHRLQHHQ